LARFAREGAWSSVCVVRVRRGRGGGVGGPRWRRSRGASAGLPPRARRLQAPPVARAHGCQQRWNVQRGRASGPIGARRPRKPRISMACETQGPLSPTAAREQLSLPSRYRGVQSLLTCFGGLWYSVMAAFDRCLLCSLEGNLQSFCRLGTCLCSFLTLHGAFRVLAGRRFLATQRE
jgi:hypothetical protein